MTRIVRRIAGTTVLLTVLSIAGPVEAADRAAGRQAAPPAWEMIWQRLLAVIGVSVPPIEEILPRKGAGIDPNGAILEDPVQEPILNKKGAGIDPNG